MTPAQKRTLKKCADDGTIIFGGLDSTVGVRIDVVYRLYQMGFLLNLPPSSCLIKSEWELSDSGKKYVESSI